MTRLSQTYALQGFESDGEQSVVTPFGEAGVTRGVFAGVDVVHISRHGAGHPRLSNHVNHRANVWALRELGARAVIGCTACGAVDSGLPLGSLVVFDDFHFLANRLPDGSLCTFHTEPGDRKRAHWIYELPYSETLRRALVDGAAAAGQPLRDGGVYGHVDGPRFNSAAEISQLSQCGVTAVSQTGGPETVLCGELALPYALVGFATDRANSVGTQATPVEELIRRIAEGANALAAMLAAALPVIARSPPRPVGTIYRFEED